MSWLGKRSNYIFRLIWLKRMYRKSSWLHRGSTKLGGVQMAILTKKTKLFHGKRNFFQGGPAKLPDSPEVLLAYREWCFWLTNAAAVPTTPSRARDRRLSGRNGNQTFAWLARGWPGGNLITTKKTHPNPLFAQFLDASRSPYGQSGKKWLPFRPENILSRALEGVVGTAAALVNQKHHLR